MATSLSKILKGVAVRNKIYLKIQIAGLFLGETLR